MSKQNYIRKPDWLKIKIKTDSNFNETSDLIKRQKLNTIIVFSLIGFLIVSLGLISTF